MDKEKVKLYLSNSKTVEVQCVALHKSPHHLPYKVMLKHFDRYLSGVPQKIYLRSRSISIHSLMHDGFEAYFPFLEKFKVSKCA